MNSSNAFLALQNVYFTLDQNFNKLMAACTTDAQRDQVRLDYLTARDNFYEARSRTFADNDPAVAGVTSQLLNIGLQINTDLQNLQNMAAVLQAMSTAVSLASRVILLGSTA